MMIEDVFHSLKGQWNLRRTISNLGRIEGTALFKGDSNLLNYNEEGIFFGNNGKNHTIFKAYQYALIQGQIRVFFAEKPKKLFYTLDFNPGIPLTATANHLCNCDHYEATYIFINPDEFSLSYKVKGPKKDYSIHTVYRRVL